MKIFTYAAEIICILAIIALHLSPWLVVLITIPLCFGLGYDTRKRVERHVSSN
ncbi:hypothetical protein [Corynebacterium sp. sy039]|uniref:hypothetical protein n=1 Tax=Corynebacterium sp. sy039 TaxID=2599641 RepID=UPI00143DCD25|nr:hypothetical protein [Corynebacterium sp. sy039]